MTRVSEEMKNKIFDPCVDKVVELIQGQINQVELKRFRVKVCMCSLYCCEHADHSERIFSWGLWGIAIFAGRTQKVLRSEKSHNATA
jgi:hypothetical protein